MYLTYTEYCNMGGSLDETAFSHFCRRAEYTINSQSGDRTGERISKLTELPQAVKDCTFELIAHLSANCFDGSGIQSESQTLGGQSESITYVCLTKEESGKTPELSDEQCIKLELLTPRAIRRMAYEDENGQTVQDYYIAFRIHKINPSGIDVFVV